jgi:hypothetical protein
MSEVQVDLTADLLAGLDFFRFGQSLARVIAIKHPDGKMTNPAPAVG